VGAWADLGNLHQGAGQGQGAGKGGQVDTSAVGASRGKRGAEGAEGGRALGGGVPLPNGEGFGEGAMPPPQKIFEFLISNWRIFMDFESIA